MQHTARRQRAFENMKRMRVVSTVMLLLSRCSFSPMPLAIKDAMPPVPTSMKRTLEARTVGGCASGGEAKSECIRAAPVAAWARSSGPG